MKLLRFHPDISLEIKDSNDWYQGKGFGLGDDFINELESAYQAIMEFPETWPYFKRGFRRYLLSRFPFSVIYRIEEDIIYIIAVMHHKRKPGYWTKRL